MCILVFGQVKRVRCGILICHDFRYDELYREYLLRGVQLMLHSYHNGHSTVNVRGAGDTSFAHDWCDRNSYGGERVRESLGAVGARASRHPSDVVLCALLARVYTWLHCAHTVGYCAYVASGIVMSTMQAYAANNGMWISANNTSMAISQWPSFVVTPDGVVAQQAQHEVPDILMTDVDTRLNFHDGARWSALS